MEVVAGPGILSSWRSTTARRDRTVYSLTEKGREALRRFGKRPLEVTPVKSEALIRLLVADLAGEAATRKSFATLREDITELRARLDEAEAAAEDLPERRMYLLIANRHLRRLLDLYEELAKDVEHELT